MLSDIKIQRKLVFASPRKLHYSLLLAIFLFSYQNLFAECALTFPKKVPVNTEVVFESLCPEEPEFDGPLERQWEFGDTENRISGGNIMAHTYTKPGSYVVFVRFPGSGLLPQNGIVTVTESNYSYRAAKSNSVFADVNSNTVWSVNRDNSSITGFNWVTLEKRIYATGKGPTSLAILNNEIWVVCEKEHEIQILDIQSGTVMHQLDLPWASLPYGIALHKQNKKAYITLQATGEVLEIDTQSKSTTRKIKVGPWPRSISLNHEGTKFWATRFISPQTHGEIYHVQLNKESSVITHTIPLKPQTDPELDHAVNGRGVPNGIEAILVPQEGKRVLIAGKKDNVFRGMYRDGKQLGFEHTVRSFLGSIDRKSQTESFSKRIDIDNRSLPTSMETTLNGNYIFLSTAGTNHITLLNANLNPAGAIIRPFGKSVMPGDTIAKHLAPIGMALTENDSLLFIHYLTTREIAIYDISQLDSQPNPIHIRTIQTIPPNMESLSPSELMGKQIFYNSQDERMASEGYISCAVCHLDGASDNRVYDFTDRGEGLRRTISLLGRAGMEHGPLHFSANFDEVQDFENDMRGAFGGSGFLTEAQWEQTKNTLGPSKKGLNPELDALADYVSSLKEYRKSPFRKPGGQLTESAKRGKALFYSEKVGCYECHSGKHLTHSDLKQPFKLENVGTISDSSGKRLGNTLKGIDTQTLNGLWEGGPYLHDGSALTLKEVLVDKNPSDKHGKTSHLKENEIADLIEYLMQLDGGDSNSMLIQSKKRIHSGLDNRKKITNSLEYYLINGAKKYSASKQ